MGHEESYRPSLEKEEEKATVGGEDEKDEESRKEEMVKAAGLWSSRKRPLHEHQVVGRRMKPPLHQHQVGRQIFKRVWSVEDEKNLLTSFNEFIKKGLGYQNSFAAFFKYWECLGGKFNKSQVDDKLRRLKTKYHNNIKKAEKGRGLGYFETNEQRDIFKISMEIWGNHEEEALKSHEEEASKEKKEKATKLTESAFEARRRKLEERISELQFDLMELTYQRLMIAAKVVEAVKFASEKAKEQ